MALFFMLLLFSIIFWFIYRSKRAKNEQLSKKFLIPFFITAGIFVLAGGAIDTETANEDTTNLENENAKLTDQLEQMNDQQTELEESVKKLETKLESEEKENIEFEETIDELKEENTTLDEKIEELEKENKELEESVAAKKAEKEKVAAEKKDEETRVAIAEKKDKETKSTSSSSKQQTQSSTKSNNDTSNDGDCDIKGSENGIYHTPGSTYYSRTKNVAEWFCSTAEAEGAGYRAPER